MSRIWTWVWGKFLLEAEEVPGRPLAFRVFGEAPFAADQPGLFQLVEVHVQAGAGDFGIGRQLVLRWETPVIWVVPVAEMPEDDLGRRRQPALLDRPVGGTMAPSAPVTVSRFTIASNTAIRKCASSWRIFPARTRAQLNWRRRSSSRWVSAIRSDIGSALWIVLRS
jgi:hypothetical protein